MVQEAVEDSCGCGDIADEFTPILNGSVGCHHGGFGFVSTHDDLEEVFAGFGWELLDAHVVDDEQVALEVFAHDAFVFVEEV